MVFDDPRAPRTRRIIYGRMICYLLRVIWQDDRSIFFLSRGTAEWRKKRKKRSTVTDPPFNLCVSGEKSPRIRQDEVADGANGGRGGGAIEEGWTEGAGEGVKSDPGFHFDL